MKLHGGKTSLSGLSIPILIWTQNYTTCKTCKFLSQCVVCKNWGWQQVAGGVI